MKRLQEVGLVVAELLTRLVHTVVNRQARLALALQRYAYASPLRLLTLTIGSVFLAELAIMFILYLWSPFSLFEDVLLDTFLLSFLILPLIYLLLFRPLTLNIKNLREAAQAEIQSLAQFPDENPNPVLRISQDGVIMYANRSSQELLAAWNTQSGGPATHVWLETISRLLKTGKVEEIELDIGNKVFAVICAPFPKSGYVNLYGRDITEHRQADQALRESEERFKAIASSTPDHLIVQDRELRYLLVINPQLGLTEQAMLGRTDYDLISSEDAYRLTQVKRQVIETGASVHLELPLVASTGERQFFEGSFVPKFNSTGQVDGLIGYFKNVTERKRAEDALRKSEERYRSLFNGMTEGFALHDIICDEKGTPRDYRFLEINPSFERLTGLKREEVVGKRVSQVLPTIEPYWVEIYGQVALTGEPVHFENYASALGRLYEVYAYCPAPGQFAAVFMDITARKQAEVELRISEEKLKTLFKLLPAGLSILNEERRIVEVNPALGQILDLSEEKLVKGEYGQRTYLRADGTPMSSGEFPSVRAFKEQRIVENVEIGVIKENGAALWTNVSAVPLPFPDWRVVVITSDLTERKQAEAERERLLEQARRDQEAIETLAGILQQERDTLQTIMENTRAHLAYLDAQFNFVRVNTTYAAGSGHTSEELIGRNHFELFPNPENQAIFEQVRETGEPIALQAKPFEFADQPERGTTYWDWTLSPVEDNKGQVQGLVLSLLDVTEIKQAEEKIRQALVEAQHHETEISALLLGSRAVLRYREFEPAAQFLFNTCRHLIGAATGFISVLAPDGTLHKIVSAEPACPVDPMRLAPPHRLQSQQAGEVIFYNNFSGSEWAELLPPDHNPLDNILFAPLKIDQEIVGWLNLANKPGGFSENEARMAAAFSELAAIALFNSRTLASLENSETRFRSVAQSAGEGIITIDSQGKIVFWNKAATTMLGYTADEALGQPLTFIIPAEFRPAHRQGVERLVAGGVPRLIGKTVEMMGLKKDGCEFPLELSLSTWKVSGEVFFTGLIHDITERKEAEIALRRSHQELEQRVRERTAELAHINQTLEQRVKERTRELATLLEASHNLASTLDMEQLLGLILDQLKRVLDCSGALIFKVDGEMLVALAHRGPIPPAEVAELRFLLRYAPAYQQVILQRTPVIIPDVRGDTPQAHCYRESVGERLETTFAYVRSWLGVPLMVQEQVIGMLSLHHKEPYVYTSQHAELALAFATQAAVAIDNARLYKQAQELATMQERQRLARDLHDSVSQSLFSASLSAEVLPRLWERHPEEGRRCLAELHRLTRGALAEMRTLLLELRPTALIETALGDLLGQLAEAIAGRARLPVTRTIEPYPPLPPEVQVALYRVAQEALNNVVKHAGAGQVEVSLRPASILVEGGEPKNGVELRISDDGRGFEAGNVPPVCLGLSIMRERAETIGASLEIKSQIGQGTQVIVVWPGA